MKSITQRDIDHLEKVGNYFDIHDDYYNIHERFYFIFDGDYIENVFLGYDHILAIDVDEYIDSIKTKDDERKLVNREFMSFMEELKWQRKVCLSLNEGFAISRIDTLMNKLQELKGSDK